MDDLDYNQNKLEDIIGRINSNINNLEEELGMFKSAFDEVKSNWSGDEYNKAEKKLSEIEDTLNKVLEDQKNQRDYLQGQNEAFASQRTGF